jgi:hypothetical protein
MSKKWDSQRVFAWIGKLSLIVGVLLGLIKLYQNLWPGGADVIATCTYHDFALPPNVADSLERVWEAESAESIAGFISSPEKDDEAGRSVLASKISEGLRNAWDEDLHYGRMPYGGYAEIALVNNGRAIAKDVVLDLPYEGTVLMTAEKRPKEARRFSGRIENVF